MSLVKGLSEQLKCSDTQIRFALDEPLGHIQKAVTLVKLLLSPTNPGSMASAGVGTHDAVDASTPAFDQLSGRYIVLYKAGSSEVTTATDRYLGRVCGGILSKSSWWLSRVMNAGCAVFSYPYHILLFLGRTNGRLSMAGRIVTVP